MGYCLTESVFTKIGRSIWGWFTLTFSSQNFYFCGSENAATFIKQSKKNLIDMQICGK